MIFQNLIKDFLSDGSETEFYEKVKFISSDDPIQKNI